MNSPAATADGEATCLSFDWIAQRSKPWAGAAVARQRKQSAMLWQRCWRSWMTSNPSTGPSEVRHILPDNSSRDVELTIVAPALNEQITVGEFVDWCKE